MLQPCRARSALPSSTCEKGALLLLPLVSVTSHCSVLVQRLKSAGQICGGCYASAAPKLVHGGSPAGFIKMMPCLHIALSVMATFTDLPARQQCGRPKHHSHHCMALPLASLSGTAAIAAAGRRHRVPLKKIKHLHATTATIAALCLPLRPPLPRQCSASHITDKHYAKFVVPFQNPPRDVAITLIEFKCVSS